MAHYDQVEAVSTADVLQVWIRPCTDSQPNQLAHHLCKHSANLNGLCTANQIFILCMQILINYLQITAILKGVTIEWPAPVLKLLSAAGVVSNGVQSWVGSIH
jgi:hypothetical protein